MKRGKLSDRFKRMTDIGLSGSIMLLVSPLLLIIALGIKITSKGRVIYKQERLGKDKTPFIMYKFRTMIPEAENEGARLALPNDPRVTSFGKILRKYHLDELTQLWNVLKGDMSLIGPRPEREIYVQEIEKLLPEYISIFNIKPGISSLGMIKYGYASDLNQMVERAKIDLEYLDNRNLSGDIKIFFNTFKAIFKGQGI